MRALTACLMISALTVSVAVSAEEPKEIASMSENVTPQEIQAVSPALADALQNVLQADVWQRPGLSPRDRSIVTVAAVIAGNQTQSMHAEFERALDNGVRPAELSEIITHLAFYSGWNNAMSAVRAAHAVFVQRGIAATELPAAKDRLLPLDEVGETRRATMVQNVYGPISQGVVKYTADVLFRNLWLRSALAPRDRSLITVSALVTAGQVEQIPFHLNRAMDNGLTREQASEMLTQLAFYAGWPKVFSAMPVAGKVFETRKS